MTNNKDNLQKGKVIADKNILLSIIKIATKETTGVASIANGLTLKLKGFVSSNCLDGCEIKYNNKGKLIIDVYVCLYYNYNVSEVSYKIQKNIKNSLSTMIDCDLCDVNVHVVDVVMSEEENN